MFEVNPGSFQFAVFGDPIEHSLSPVIHQQFAKQFGISLTYSKQRVEAGVFEACVLNFFKQGGKGLNITLPYKQQAFALATKHHLSCVRAKAANTLWMENGALHAANTDGIGLIRDLARLVDLKNKRLLILGAGGAARGILDALLKQRLKTLCLSNRSGDKAKQLAQEFPGLTILPFRELTQAFDLIINATSSSLSENTLELPPSLLTPDTYCYDLAYSLEKPTSFMQWALNHGAKASDGLGMLVEQAAEAFFIWHGLRPEVTGVLQDLISRQYV